MNEDYVRFPLWAFAYGQDRQERMRVTLGWAVIEGGRNGIAKFEEENPGRLEALDVPEGPWNYEDGQAWALGCDFLRVNNKSLPPKVCLESHAKMEAFMVTMNRHCGRPDDQRVWVMVKRDWFWRAFAPVCGQKCDDPLPWDLFTVLCAIKSKVGDDPKAGKDRGMAFVTWPEIQCRSMGYLNEVDMEKCLPLRTDDEQPYSRDVIRNRSRRIRADDFVMSYTPRVTAENGNQAWKPVAYGYGVSDAQLIAWADQKMRTRAGGYKGKLRAKQEAQARLSLEMRSKERPR